MITKKEIEKINNKWQIKIENNKTLEEEYYSSCTILFGIFLIYIGIFFLIPLPYK